MPFGLTIGTERAHALQKSIQDELTKRGYSPDADPVMAEYITIMIINNKTEAQITSELDDLIGSDYDPSFTQWLFAEAAKGTTDSELPAQPEASSSTAVAEQPPAREIPPHQTGDTSKRPATAPRSGIYQQALSQALPSTNPAQKRTASARSPSPNHPNKTRRTDLPTGPRAMQRDGNNGGPGPRSLLERVGPVRSSNSSNGFQHDDIQARIDNITLSSPDPNMGMMAGYGGMNGIDMNAMASMANPMMLQEMMMNQMALMAQMASTMGMMGGGPGFPMQGVMPGDMQMYPGGGMNGFPQQQMNGSGRGRGAGRGGRGTGRGRGGVPPSSARIESEPEAPVALTVVAPTPSPAQRTLSTSIAQNSTPSTQPLAYALPERPQSPTLCKFGLKCTNSQCRYSHPSPVATPESGVVLSNEACEKGKDCKDKDCIKAHVSPAVLNPQSAEQQKVVHTTITTTPSAPATHSAVPCRFGAACTRPDCTFAHPSRLAQHHKPAHASSHFTQQCRFGAGCTRSTCSFQHPPDRVLPTTFHRGLSTTGPIVSVQTPEAGSMGGPSPHRSVKFNNAGKEAALKDKLKEIEEKKSAAEKAVKDAQAAAAAAGNKDESKSVAIAA